MPPRLSILALFAALACATPALAAELPGLKAEDAFDIEVATDPQISPDGTKVVYVRRWADVMTDRRYSNLWIVDVAGGTQRGLTTGKFGDSTPRWSPDGKRIAFVSDRGGSPQIYVAWLDSWTPVAITNHVTAPGNLAWSPDGRTIAFTALVPGKAPSVASMPSPPEGAKWAEPARVVDRLVYRFNGAGYLPEGFSHVFVVPADGGTARQVSSGDFHHGGSAFGGGSPVWTPDGQSILISANRRHDWDMEPLDSDVWGFAVKDGAARRLTDRHGPDDAVAVSPDGKKIAWLGFDDRYQGYQVTHLYVRDLAGGEARVLAADLDRDAGEPAWAPDGKGVYFSYDDHGRTKLALAGLDGALKTVAEDLGAGTSSYTGSGGFSVARDGTVAFAHATWNRPGDIALLRPGARQPSVLTALNDDLFAQRRLATIEAISVPSFKDSLPIEAWILKPPGFDPAKRYPLILEIHGGPFAAYGPLFDIEKQVWSAKGYVIVYANPRGSTSYGETFGNLIHHAYPGDDFFDLDSVVTAVVGRGYVDPGQLFVTGGSGGGVLTCWMIGRSDRFRAAATVYPVINWFSWVLTSDIPSFGAKYWFPGMPWDETEHYMKRSLFSVFKNVKTPTMVITGEADWRTPISESEQYYTALKLKGVETVLVRVPDEPHGIRARPSHHVAKMLNIVGWFETHRPGDR
jgi:dipeptidyl aminopeptidase/acylaminoacyl peptidase